jgi:hypothetical protein
MKNIHVLLGLQSCWRWRHQSDFVDEHRRNVGDNRRHRLRHRQLQGEGQALHLPQQHDPLRHRLGQVRFKILVF